MEECHRGKGVFLPKVILVDRRGKHLETTNRTKLPSLENLKKSRLLGYDVYKKDMPLINPADIAGELEIQFAKSKFARKRK